MIADGKKINRFPRHLAVIMDGNGRWAKKYSLPRVAGHKAGAKVARQLVENCLRLPIQVLTLFAFSRENWQRPKDEVDALMDLFLSNLQNELSAFKAHNIHVRFIGDMQKFSTELQQQIYDTQQQTANNTGLNLVIAVNYSGRWDIVQAMSRLATDIVHSKLLIEDINEENVSTLLSLADLPSPDLLIRTSGEQRISNFFLWQLAYTELYFTNTLFPDFDSAHLQQALECYQQRIRRFGRSDEQITTH